MPIKERKVGLCCGEVSEQVILRETKVQQEYPITGVSFFSCPGCRNDPFVGAGCAFLEGGVCKLNTRGTVILPLT